jgi:membrane protease YdiL (CAAX protease family)
VLAEFDAYLNEHPYDDIAAVERCRFIDGFAYADEPTIESAVDDSEACQESLAEIESAPVVQLYLLEMSWDEERITQGEELMKAAETWAPNRLAALHGLLSEAYAGTDELQSGKHAFAAVQLDPSCGRQLAAANYLVLIGANARVAATLEQFPEDQWDSWTLGNAVSTLLSAGDPEAARRLIESHSDISLSGASAIAAARALFDAGDTQAASALLASARSGAAMPGLDFQRKYFELQRDHGSPQDAAAAYEELRAAGYPADPLARYRLSLLSKDWSARWAWQDGLGIGGLVLLLVTMALLPGVLILPIHYRSVVKQLKGHHVAPASVAFPWGLGHLWYALAAVVIAGCVSTYVFAYDVLHVALTQFSNPYATVPLTDDRALGRCMVWYAIVAFVALLPLWIQQPGAIIVGTRPVGRSILVGAGAGFAFVIMNGIIQRAMALPEPALALGTETMRSLQGVLRVYGPWTTAAVMVLFIPLVEELVFRGVFLRAVSRHLALWAAVLLQALLFMLIHEDIGSFPAVFAVALVAAWLAWSRGGLVAPMAFHGVINGFAFIGIMAFGSAVGKGT